MEPSADTRPRFKIYPPRSVQKFQPGDDVWVLTAKKALFETATVVQFSTEGEYAGRYLVKYHSDGSTYNVRPNRILLIEKPTTSSKLVIVSDETRDYK